MVKTKIMSLYVYILIAIIVIGAILQMKFDWLVLNLPRTERDG
uniref:Uncharacterized protein n=1 Tax=Candidatus Kentrum sp. LFY TaxID=2126342 RepID=A0A450WI16_9GAMM|nr:MAG: hypothetical protein BECKLFY1418C_GA0070996_102518 [Candidatus Kentron sp. LFY]